MKEENELYIASSVASSRSMQTSLEAIRLQVEFYADEFVE